MALGFVVTPIPTTTTTTLPPLAFSTVHHSMHVPTRFSVSYSSRRSTLFMSSNIQDDDDNEASAARGDDDGINLAAEFLKITKAKGIELKEEDLLFEEDEEEDDDDEDMKSRQQQQRQDGDEDEEEEEEMNIPQGAMNAFLGYDTGINAGDKLAGNVTLTNDQLYSEVKERVLESAGGFVDFLKGAADDDEDEDDDEEKSLIDDVLQISKLSAPEKREYQPPQLVPDSDLTAGEVVITVLEALLHNNVPTPNRGVEILFGYSSPGSQIKNEVGLTPAEYADFLKDTEYKVLFDHQDVVR